MIRLIKSYTLGKYLNLRLKMLERQERAYDFAAELKKVQKCLVILPDQNETDGSNQDFLKRLTHIFPQARISTFVSSSLRKEDINWLGVPNEKYLKTIRDEHFDLVVDLNPVQDKIAVYLSALSNAPMRLNLASGAYDKVYNLHFRTSEDKKTAQRLENIGTYIEFLKKAV